MKKIVFLLIFTAAILVAGAVQAIISNGLVAYYPFSGNTKDASGNGNDGTVVGAQLTSDRFGKADSAYAFYGNGDYVDCGHDTSLDITGPITIALWIYPQDLLSVGRILSKGVGESGYELAVYANNLQFFINGSELASHDLTGLENTWIFIAAVYDQTLSPNSVKLYVNQDNPVMGGLNYVDPIGVNTGNLYLGNYKLMVMEPFHGKMDSIRIYDRALSAAEIANLYTSRDATGASVPATVTPLLLDN